MFEIKNSNFKLFLEIGTWKLGFVWNFSYSWVWHLSNGDLRFGAWNLEFAFTEMSIAYIGIGSNLGDRKANIEEAIACMKKEKGFQVLRLSSLYESDPLGLKDQSRFLNGVVEVESTLLPKVLLLRLLSIEADMGRVRDRKWGPRVIDLDLLLYDRVIIKKSVNDEIVVPHPEMHRRNFVLIPLIELAPDTIHPQNKQPLKKLLHLLKKDKSYGRVEIYLG